LVEEGIRQPAAAATLPPVGGYLPPPTFNSLD